MTDLRKPYPVILPMLLLLAFATGSCSNSGPNPTYCDESKPCKGANSYCDPVGHVCTDLPAAACSDTIPCTDPTRSICDPSLGEAGMCVACTSTQGCADGQSCDQATRTCTDLPCEPGPNGDALCADRDAQAPYCSMASDCVECLEDLHCADTNGGSCQDYLCTACKRGADCESGLCQLEEGTCTPGANIIYVAKTGADNQGCGSADAPCLTIQQAINKTTTERKFVLVDDGQYPETITIDGVEAHLVGRGNVTVTSDLATAGAAVVRATGDAVVSLRNVTVKGTATSTKNAGIHCALSAMTLANVVVDGFAGDESNHGVFVDNCQLTAEKSVFQNNYVGIGGDGGTMSVSGATVRRNEFGIFMPDTATKGMQLILEDTTVEKNPQGGVLVRQANEGLTVTAVLRQCKIDDNQDYGVIAYGEKVSLTVQETTISNSHRGLISSETATTIQRSVIQNNTYGGIILLSNSEVHVTNNFIVSNGNTGSASGGMGILGPNSKGVTVAFNTFADNLTQKSFTHPIDESTALRCEDTDFVATNNIFVRLVGDTNSLTSCQAEYSLVPSDVTLPPGTGNVQGEPIFVDREGGDYHLAEGSPGIDSADPAATVEVDFDGDARPQGGRHDMGADEVQ